MALAVNYWIENISPVDFITFIIICMSICIQCVADIPCAMRLT